MLVVCVATLAACGASTSEPRAPASAPAASANAHATTPGGAPICGPVGTKCDPNAPPCVCGPGAMCHGFMCSGGVWTTVEVFPAQPTNGSE
jgi:hypothetical protein